MYSDPRRFRAIPAILRAAAVLGTPFYNYSASRIVPLTRYDGSIMSYKRTYHRGEQETARRRRQVERGTLTASNGLALRLGSTNRFVC